ncbi:hypothetical protein F0562_011636 [Nyssa sinensis]|uniref:AAA+ ATPase domain-containing protein n=1 Tax=Nyssa sinensis TaxID=561372 RepID=A0A5J4ZQ00_9ASTE|nr:hypothetical protein F0562_011636 [Nyssa sinensis]
MPKMGFEEFLKAMRSDKIELLTSKKCTRMLCGCGHWEFIVNSKEIPGDKSLHKTKWAMKLDENEARVVLEEYMGPRYEIEKHTSVLVGTLTAYPDAVASSISSRVAVELGMLTTVIVAAAVVAGGFLASVVFVNTSFLFVVTVYVIWTLAKPFLKNFLGFIFSILVKARDNLVEIGDGGIFFKLNEFYTFGGVSDSLEMLKPILLVLFTLVLLIRFALSRRPKNSSLWDMWQIMDFARSNSTARADGSTGVTFSDVAGIDNAVEELQELVNYLKNPELFDKMGIKPPHGVLLEGPPGCGKTLVAKAIAGEASVPFYQMAGPEFIEIFVGVGSARIADLFKRAKVNKPSVIFIDEIDAIAIRCQENFSGSTSHQYSLGTQEREITLNQLLTELDGFHTGKGVIFLAATNRMDMLDPALLRPGRFDRKIRVGPPNAEGRLQIMKIYAAKVKMSQLVDLSTYARNLSGWTGAMLAQLLQEAALVAVRKGHESILQSDMDDAVDRFTLGPKWEIENAKVERCDHISIIPHGQTLSQIVFHRLDDEMYMFERRPQLLHRLQVLLGGRAAEEVIYGRNTSRASINYLADATWLARKMITIWNLENPMVIHGEPPPWRKKVKFVGPRLDFEGSLHDDYDFIESPINFNMDDQVVQRTEELMLDLYEKNVSLLRRHHVALLKAVKVLLDQREISGEEIEFILNKYPPQTPISNLLEEENPGSLPFVRQEQGHQLE